MQLLDSRGNPVSSSDFKKSPAPKTGEAFAIWGENTAPMSRLPLGGLVQFNLENLTVHDYRAMRSHYQVNASLAVLSFMQHQSDWHIECSDKAIAAECEEQLREIWTPLNRALSHANWAGYSPNILDWKNDNIRDKVVIDKIKDLVPESAEINWKEIDAWRPADYEGHIRHAKVKIYDGIKQVGAPWATPVGNTLWYPLLMENGNYKGRNLLKAAFTSWYFSILIHLFANRYYERFGEPIVVGRAPFEDDVKLPGTEERVNGIEYMLKVISDLRSRSVVALPDDKTEMSNGRSEYDYTLEYLESQMRGADWERYLTRLDEEISIGLFTPILLLRTADVGSYNLGVGHMQMYLWMLNAMNSDRAEYINKYILSKITDYNFSSKAPRPKIKFRKLGNQNAEIMRTIVDQMMSQGRLGVDVKELGEIAGLTMTEIEQTLEDNPSGLDDTSGDTGGDKGSLDKPAPTTKKITARIRSQVENHFRNGGIAEDSNLSPGYRKQLEQELLHSRVADPITAANVVLGNTMEWADEAKVYAHNAEEFVAQFERVLESEMKAVLP
jgi:hypothetical protein